ncbi:MAG TPA: nucleotide pyrophosphohydrolase [Candidatus Saccharimonadia bacterium]|nr:nucleotide pyrophosphohydrolase [Candidatus Saccharimonadia bacterium]
MSDLKDLMEQAEVIRLKYQELNAKHGKAAWGIRDYAMGFMGDMGQLQKLIMAKENLRDMPDVDAKLAHELADCLWSVLVIANYYGLDLESEFVATMARIADRIAGANA